jgi:ubiquinol-cytochrome c reductase cytochrome b subunit
MNYTPSAEEAFASVEYIMRDVDFGWLLRYLHSTGASAFFFVVYLHMFRGLLYGSYKKPRELIWVLGMAIYLVLMAEGFMGYVLPWGQMSYWGANVIVSLFGSIPIIGEDLLVWIPWRLPDFRCHLESILRSTRGRSANRVACPCCIAHPCAARSRIQ